MLLSAGLMFGSVSAVAVNAEESQEGSSFAQNHEDLVPETDLQIVQSLIGSERYGPWLPEYAMYNCYGYALGTSSLNDPGDFSGQSHTGSDGRRLPILQLAGVVYDDLVARNYQCISMQRNTFELPDHGQNLICLRVSDDTFNDYHFMRYFNGSWFHKPSTKWLLRYLKTPTASDPWPYEGVDSSGTMWRAENSFYVGDIYFFSYKFSHNLTCSYYNQTSHRVYCQACSYEIYEDHDLQPYGDKSQCTGCYAIFTDDGYGSVILEEDETEIY